MKLIGTTYQTINFKTLGSNFNDLKFSCKFRHDQQKTSKQKNRCNQVCAPFMSEPKIYLLF